MLDSVFNKTANFYCLNGMCLIQNVYIRAVQKKSMITPYTSRCVI
ncbi:hypothetical protein A3Q56_03348, partial [Intoshia linei]